MNEATCGPTGPKYVVLDSCVLAAHYLPRSANRSPKLSQRATSLIQGVAESPRLDRRLLIPAFCIPEVFSIFAKYRFGKWNTQVRGQCIDDLAYWQARLRFRNDIHNGKVIQQIDLSRYHILATDLISPVDHHYEYYRSRREKVRKVPMGASDHLLIAVGIDLVKCRGRDDVLIVTADRRLGHILNRARKIRRASAARLGLIRIAKDLGLAWGPSIYPSVINLASAKDEALREAFGEWPPSQRSTRESTGPLRLTEKQEKILVAVYKKATKETSESFLYTDEFEIMYEAFVAKSGIDATRTQVWKWLSNVRKRGRLPRKARKRKQ